MKLGYPNKKIFLKKKDDFISIGQLVYGNMVVERCNITWTLTNESGI